MPTPTVLLPGPFAEAQGRMAENDLVLQRLETLVEALWRAGDPDAAAAYAELAGSFAYHNHPGRYDSPRLERTLAEIGHEHVPVPPAPAAGDGPRRVLHVLTRAYETGGHTRLAWRWMELDDASEHHVVLTDPASETPLELGRRARTVRHLSGGSLLQRARDLRLMAARADVVVLHHHMHDVVPAIALANRPHGPAVVLEDHADHVFWLGTGVTDVLVNGRRPGIDVAVQRRGVPEDRCRLLPMAVTPKDRVLDRAEAKRRLGVDADRPVLLTIAATYKYAPIADVAFLDLVRPALDATGAVLVAVGPSAEERGWHDERIHAFGNQEDIRLFLCAADVYLDSYPFSSNTAVVDAAGHGVPVVAYAPDPAAQGLLRSASPALVGGLLQEAADVEGYTAAVVRVLADREALGDASREAVERVHGGEEWRRGVADAYAAAQAVTPATVLPPRRAAEPVTEAEAAQLLMFDATGIGFSLAVLRRMHAGVVPEDRRELELPEPADSGWPWDAVAAAGAADGAAAAAVAALDDARTRWVLTGQVVTVRPDDVDAAVPPLEHALAAHPDMEVDLVVAEDPAALRRPGRVLLDD